MKRLQLILTILLLIYTAAASSLQLERQHGQWRSGLVEMGDHVAFRAVSSVERKTDVIVLFAFDILDDCKTVAPNLLVYIPEGVDTSGFLNAGLFQARVDTRDIVEGIWGSSSNDMGDTTIFIELITAEQTTLTRDIKLGYTLRIKIEFVEEENPSIYFNFSLSGSAAAINRAYSLCHNSQNHDRRYFKPQPRQTPKRTPRDADFFNLSYPT